MGTDNLFSLVKKLVFTDSEQILPPILIEGSSAEVEGIGATLDAPLQCYEDWFTGSQTIIIGDGHLNTPRMEETTTAVWKIKIPHEMVGRIIGGYLFIACERSLGGLHTLEFGALAQIYLNDNSRDIIGLRYKPDGYSDFFHHMPVPPSLAATRPIDSFKTVYSWPVYPGLLSSNGTQTLSVRIGPQVSWDIDWVGMLLVVKDKKVRVWAKTGFVLVLGAIISEIIQLIFG